MSTATDRNHNLLASIEWPARLVGLLGAGGCVLGAVWAPSALQRGYLVAYQFWLGVALGCLVLLMMQYLTGGAWGLLLRRILEAGAALLLPLALLWLPFLAGLDALYPWREEPATGAFQQGYFHLPFFLARTASYFVIWILLAALLNRWSARQDEESATDWSGRLRTLSGPGLVLYGITITFAAVDWLMSLEPHWTSTIYPPLFAVGQILSGLAFAVLILLGLANRPPFAGVMRTQHQRDLGNLLLTFVMLWAYMSFSQFLLIWCEDLPEEIPWYLRRIRAGWDALAVTLLVLQFALPFLLLLMRDVKDRPRRLAAVAGLILLLRLLDLVWWIVPAQAEGQAWSWVFAGVAWLGLGGWWLWWFARQLRRRPLLPLHAPSMSEYLSEEASHEPH